MRLHAPEGLAWVWLALDLTIITLMVRLSGGLRSEAALGYMIPLLTGAVEFKPVRVVVAGVAGGLLYTLASWAPATGLAESEWLGTRLVFLAVVTTLATWYAIVERTRTEELIRLREKLVLSDYRERLSQELHDGVQHYLVAAVCRLEWAGKMGEQDPKQALSMALGVKHTIRQGADELRYLVRRLRSPRLERHGFVEALREHLALCDDHVPFTINLQLQAEQVSLPPEVEQAALRIIQEALTNAEKHASPTEVTVSLSLTPQVLQGVVRDDGVGFDLGGVAENPATGEGLGLAGMRHRAQSVGGSLDLHSRRGEGSTLSFTIPLSHQGQSTEASGDPAATGRR
jgi:signal transduction histidine kinase